MTDLPPLRDAVAALRRALEQRRPLWEALDESGFLRVYNIAELKLDDDERRREQWKQYKRKERAQQPTKKAADETPPLKGKRRSGRQSLPSSPPRTAATKPGGDSESTTRAPFVQAVQKTGFGAKLRVLAAIHDAVESHEK